jgi:hypothetical protein
MPRSAVQSLLVLAALLALACPGARAQSPKPAGLGDPGTLQALVIETGRSTTNGITLAGRDAGQQLIVTGRYSSGQLRDLTRQVKYEATPAAVVGVDATGFLTAQQEGESIVRVQEPGGQTASLTVRVTSIVRDVPVNFANEVVPVFTRLGCNAGGCHGKSGGQNGFQLSLLGFEPREDHEFLVKEARGRRLFLAAPEQSLLLRKATGSVAHGGGSKLKVDSPAYRVLRRWIEQGVPYGRPDDPVVARIEVLPRERLLDIGGTQQLTVVAHFTDGTTRDVTRLAQFESNDGELAEVSETGLVRVKQLPGTAAVMARFQTSVDAFRLTVPLGAAVANLPPANNFIDDLVFKQLRKLGLPPSAGCDDATFLRRVTIDIAGRLPTLDETRAFLADTAADRRAKLVDRLLASPDYADYFASKWSAVLRNKRQSAKDDLKPTAAFHAWVRASLDKNLPFDQFARAILTAHGEEVQNPPVGWYREVKDAFSQVEDSAQLFLGTRLGCARCHHHPLEKWSQQDYYGFAAFFARVEYKLPPKVEVKKGEKKPKEVKAPVHVLVKDAPAVARNPRTGELVRPTVLGGRPLDLPADADPRTHLAEWMTRRDNPFFARTLVNRYWKHFFGRGLVDPEDDLRATNPPTNPELLDALARHFAEKNFDLKDLVRLICTSRVYQLDHVANEHNQSDRKNFSRFVPRRLNAEVLFDAIDQVTLARSEFQGVPPGTRAVQLPDNAFDSYFLTVFGRPDGSSACECERSGDVSLAQLLHLMNSREIAVKVGGAAALKEMDKLNPPPKGKQPANAGNKLKITPGERVAQLVADKRPHEEKIRELYLIAFAREPRPAETRLLLAHVQRHGNNVRVAYEDIVWALLNSNEFLFNH